MVPKVFLRGEAYNLVDLYILFETDAMRKTCLSVTQDGEVSKIT